MEFPALDIAQTALKRSIWVLEDKREDTMDFTGLFLLVSKKKKKKKENPEV